MTRSNQPDLSAGACAAEQAQALHQYGAVLLRGVFPPAELQAWLPRFKQAFERSDRAFMTGQMLPDQYEQLYRYGHARPEDLQYVAAWHELIFQQPSLVKLLQFIYGKSVWILSKNTQPRRQQARAPERAIGFHQDYEFIGPLISGLNCWIPLTPAGGNYPGLEIWLNSPQKPIFSLSQNDPQRQHLCAQIPAKDLWRPQLQIGDMLMMTLFTVHRTYLQPEMPETRFSYELRLMGTADQDLTCSPVIERIL